VRFVVLVVRTRLLAEIGLVVPEESGLEAWAVHASFSLLCGRAGSGTKGSAPSISISNASSESGAKLESISASPVKNSRWGCSCLLGIALVDFSRSLPFLAEGGVAVDHARLQRSGGVLTGARAEADFESVSNLDEEPGSSADRGGQKRSEARAE
jgi:hypothetical protein